MSTLDSVITWMNSPSGTVAAGGVIAVFVWKSFERLQGVVSDDTNLAIAVWLLDLKPAKGVYRWPTTLMRLSNTAFGTKILSWKAFWRSALLTMTISIIVSPATMLMLEGRQHLPRLLLMVPMQIVANIGPDFLSLAFTRRSLIWLERTTRVTLTSIILAAVASVSLGVAVAAGFLNLVIYFLVESFGLASLHTTSLGDSIGAVFLAVLGSSVGSLIAASIGLIWLALYVGSGFLLIRVTQSGERAIAWFNKRMDIENKPIQALGLVAGGLAALTFWCACVLFQLVR